MTLLTDPSDLAKATIANCVSFQELVDANDATEANTFIYLDAFPLPDADTYTVAEYIALRPSALVFLHEEVNGFRYVRDATGCWIGSGSVVVIIERNTPEDESPSESDRSFKTIIGEIIEQITQQSETAGRLAVTSILASGPHRVASEEIESKGDFQWYELTLSWGANVL